MAAHHAVRARPVADLARPVALVLALAACTADPAPRAAPTTPPPTPATTTPATTTPATTTPAITAPAETEPAAPGSDGESFVTPTRNIACEVTVEHVECSIRDRAWEPPAGRCGADPALALMFDARVTIGCGESGAERAGRTVRYGESVTVDRVTCSVARAGVTCRFGPTRRGFFLSRARYRVYG